MDLPSTSAQEQTEDECFPIEFIQKKQPTIKYIYRTNKLRCFIFTKTWNGGKLKMRCDGCSYVSSHARKRNKKKKDLTRQAPYKKVGINFSQIEDPTKNHLQGCKPLFYSVEIQSLLPLPQPVIKGKYKVEVWEKQERLRAIYRLPEEKRVEPKCYRFIPAYLNLPEEVLTLRCHTCTTGAAHFPKSQKPMTCKISGSVNGFLEDPAVGHSCKPESCAEILNKYRVVGDAEIRRCIDNFSSDSKTKPTRKIDVRPKTHVRRTPKYRVEMVEMGDIAVKPREIEISEDESSARALRRQRRLEEIEKVVPIVPKKRRTTNISKDVTNENMIGTHTDSETPSSEAISSANLNSPPKAKKKKRPPKRYRYKTEEEKTTPVQAGIGTRGRNARGKFTARNVVIANNNEDTSMNVDLDVMNEDFIDADVGLNDSTISQPPLQDVSDFNAEGTAESKLDEQPCPTKNSQNSLDQEPKLATTAETNNGRVVDAAEGVAEEHMVNQLNSRNGIPPGMAPDPTQAFTKTFELKGVNWEKATLGHNGQMLVIDYLRKENSEHDEISRQFPITCPMPPLSTLDVKCTVNQLLLTFTPIIKRL